MYFVSSGLPSEQIENVNAHATMHTDIDDRTKYGPDGYSTVLSRAIEGLTVPDSFAWASMTADQEVIAEAVYWPDVPKVVLDEAKNLASVAASNDYLAVVGVGNAKDARVAIHHSAGFEMSVKFTVTYDIPSSGSMGRVRHLDRTGAEVELPVAEKFAVPGARR